MCTSLTNTGWANTNRSSIAAIANVVSARNSPRRRIAGHARRNPTPPVTATATTRASTAGMAGTPGIWPWVNFAVTSAPAPANPA